MCFYRSSLRQYLSRPFTHKLTYLAGDLLALIAAHILAIRIVNHRLNVPLEAINPVHYDRYYIPFFALVLYLSGSYESPELRRPERELELACKAVAVNFLGLILFNFVALKSQPFSRYLFFFWFALACLMLLTVRFSLRAVYGWLWKSGTGRRRVLLIGSEYGLAHYRQLLSIQRHDGFELVGWIPDSEKTNAAAAAPSLPVVATLDDWEQGVERTRADLLVLATATLPDGDGLVPQILHRCRAKRLEFELYSSALATRELSWERDEFSGCFRVSAPPPWSLALQSVLKRGLDLIIGLIGSLVTVLLTPFVGLVIKLQDGGPIFYRSAYLIEDGSYRHYLKFRSMCIDADEILMRDAQLRARFSTNHKLMDDPRVTRFGRFLRRSSIDEFPQFFSVLKGEMAFVGPRTIRREESAHYGTMLPKLLSARPGVTGFWQVMGRQTTTYAERVQMDMFYIDHWSIWLDLVIIGKTFWKVVKSEGAY